MAYQVLLTIHILGGAIALCTGSAIAVLRKGDRRHRILGRFFVWSMLTASIMGVTMATIRYNPFLLLIGLFSGYMAWSGWRMLRATPDNATVQIGLSTALIAVAMFMVSIAVTSNEGLVVPIFFAAGMVVVGATDIRVALRMRRGPPPRTLLISRHLALMGGALIASWTAFLVVNISLQQYQWVLWIGPSVIGTVGLIRAGKKYVKT